jgi:RecJ-like exonuclease
MQIDIPLSCPSCSGKMYSVSYESVFPILKKRSWQVCKECKKEHLPTVALRMCLTCGHVGCCDSSIGKHTTKHFEKTGHIQ